jgi:ABC-type transporter Mla subunit MlaD
VPVNLGSVAGIQQVTLTTAKHLEISTGGGDEPLHASGDTLMSAGGGGGFFDVPDLEGLVKRLELVLDNLVAVLGVDRAALRAAEGGPEPMDVTRLLTSLDEAMNVGGATMRELDGVISENRAGFQEMVHRLVELQKTTTELMAQFNAVVSENRQPLNETVLNLERLTGETNRHLEELAGSLRQTLQQLEDVGGNASDLLDSQRPALEEILINLQNTTRNLSEFSRTLAEQPQALIRGRKTQGRKPEESQ